MNKFEKKIYEQLFAQKIDFYTKSINEFNYNYFEKKEKNAIKNKNMNKNEEFKNISKPLDYDIDFDEEITKKEPMLEKKASKKSKFVMLISTFVCFLLTIFAIYYIFSTTSDTDQIVAYYASYPTAKRVNNIKYFIDSNDQGYVIGDNNTNIEKTLTKFTKSFNEHDVDLDSDSMVYLNFASEDLNQVFKKNKNQINKWIENVDKITKEEKKHVVEYKEIEKKPTTSEKNNARISFYKKYGVFNNVISANKEYKENKDVIDQIGDFSLSDKKIKTVALDKYSPSKYIDFNKVILALNSATTQKYKKLNLIDSDSIKIVTLSEMKTFSQDIENLNFSDAKLKFASSFASDENFIKDFENLKSVLRNISTIEKNEVNDFNKILNDQSYVKKVKKLFEKVDYKVNNTYCKDFAKRTKNKKNSYLKQVTKCIKLQNNAYINSASINEEGVVSDIKSLNFISSEKNTSSLPITFVMFDTTQNAQKFLENYDKKEEKIKGKYSILYNNSNMLILLPYAKNSAVEKYLKPLDVNSWSYRNYYEQFNKS